MAGFLQRIQSASARVNAGRSAFGGPSNRRLFSLPNPPVPRLVDEEDEERRRRSGGGGGGAVVGRAFPRGLPFSSSRAGMSPVGKKVAIASGAQPAVFKIISAASGGRRAGALIEYLGTRTDERTGEKVDIEIYTEQGEIIDSAEARAALLQSWETEFSQHAQAKDVGRFLIEHEGSALDPASVRDVLQDAFGDRDFAFATEENGDGGTAVRAVVALTAKGNKLPLSPIALRRTEEALSDGLEEHGRRASSFSLEASGHAVEGIRYHLNRIASGTYGRAYDDEAKPLELEAINAEARSWAKEIGSYRARDVAHTLFSAREGTNPQAFFVAVQTVMDREFAGHRWVAAQHHDKGHVHVHVGILYRNDAGERLKTSRADLERYREAIATAAREQGIDMVATRRTDIAATRPFNAKHAGLVERDEAQEATRRRVEEKRAQAFSPEPHPTRQKAHRQAAIEWSAAVQVLEMRGQPDAAKVATGIVFQFAQHGIEEAKNISGATREIGSVESPQDQVHRPMEKVMAVRTREQLSEAIDDIQAGFHALRETSSPDQMETLNELEKRAIAISIANYDLQASQVSEASARTQAEIADSTDTGTTGDDAERLETDERLELAGERALDAAERVEAQALQSGAAIYNPVVQRTLAQSRDAQTRARSDIAEAQAEQGVERAELEEGRRRLRGTGESVPVAPETFRETLEKDNRGLAERLTWTSDPDSKETSYKIDGKEAFRDQEDRVTLGRGHTPDMTEAGLRFAMARFGAEISVEGTDDFKREVVEVAASRGLQIQFKEPELAELYNQLTADRQAGTEAPANSLSAGGRTAEAEAASVEAQPGPSQPQTETETAKTGERLLAGELINHGAAPYEFQKGESASYYAVIETEAGKERVWGVDIKRAIEEAQAREGDTVELRNVGKEPVTVTERIMDDEGNVIATRQHEAMRNTWHVEVKEREAAETATAEAQPEAEKAAEVSTQSTPQPQRGASTSKDNDMELGD